MRFRKRVSRDIASTNENGREEDRRRAKEELAVGVARVTASQDLTRIDSDSD